MLDRGFRRIILPLRAASFVSLLGSAAVAYMTPLQVGAQAPLAREELRVRRVLRGITGER